jgi:RNA polymerase sigma-70 factor (ECF subfamily)
MTARRASHKDQRMRFERTVMPHLDAIHSAALRLARNPDDAADLLQETILRAFQFFHQFSDGTNLRAWLLTILYNNFRSSYRRGGREQLASSSEEFERQAEAESFACDQTHHSPEDAMGRRMLGSQLVHALSALPPEFRESIVLVDVQELNYQEVAMVLGVPLGTVKSRVSRGRALLRHALQEIAFAPGKTGS